MFALGAPGDVDFKSAPLNDAALAIEDVQRTGLRHDRTAPCLRMPCVCKNRRTVLTDPAKVAFELADIPMREQLRLTVGWSNNVSAAIVAHALGFKYIWALTRRSGLTRPIWPAVRVGETRTAGPSGLFLRKDFNCFRPRPPADAPAGPAAGGTARSVAMLMTVLAQGTLIDHAAHVGMGEMLRRVHPGFDVRGNGGEWSPTGKGFSDAGWIAEQPTWHFDPATLPSAATYATWPLAISKIGWEPGDVLADAIIVRAKRPRMSGPDSFTTVVVVAIGPDNVGALQDFGSALATALDIEHL
jgi:hypothetical protein